MSITGLIVGVILFLITIGIVIVPLLLQNATTEDSFRNRQRERALAYYERVLRNIRDLDDDLATQKIHQDEYQAERERWMSQGVELLRMLEELDNQHNIVDTNDADDADIDAAIESAIAQADVKQQVKEMS